MSDPAETPPASGAVRRFGRFELRAVLARSERTMLWLVFDPRRGHELTLAMPRVQPPDTAARDAWFAEARRASRLAHPSIAPVLEVGAQDHWPFVACDRALGSTLPEWLAANGTPQPVDAARWVCDALQALAYMHDAGLAHRDVQPQMLVIGDHGRVRLLGLGVAPRAPASASDERHAHRVAAERDVLAAGVLLNTLLTARPALDEPDLGKVVDRLVPSGRELLRLPRITPVPLPAPLRVIADRATSAQPRLRYHSARTLQHALDGWREAHERDSGGPIARLLDRLGSVGHLPALPGVGARAARLALMERGRTHEMAELVLEDLALSFELLRQVNGAQVQAMQASGGGPVLTLRRAIAMIGLDGVRHAAAGLRAWPGPLAQDAANDLRRLFERVRLAGSVATVIRPAGFDAEVTFLVTVLQNLGRLVVQYHFADEAAQMRQLMQAAPAERDGEGEQPGLSEDDAACAVLGADVAAFGTAVARHWGLGDEVMHLIRRLSPALPVRAAERDDDLIRATASCANEAVDATGLPAQRQGSAIERVAQRYAKLLGVTARDLQDALQAGWSTARMAVSQPPADASTIPVLNDAP